MKKHFSRGDYRRVAADEESFIPTVRKKNESGRLFRHD